MSEIVKILKQIGMVSLIVLGLGTMGLAVEALPWDRLTLLLALVRRCLMTADWIWDIDGQFGLYFWMGCMLTLLVAFWSYRGYLLIINKLHK